MYKKLSADPNALILSIISLAILFLGCCCGFFVLISFTLSIVGLVIANKSLKEYYTAPDQYDSMSKNNVFVAKVLNIIALVVSSLFVLVYILYFVFFGSLLTAAAVNEVINNDKIEQINESRNEEKLDSIDEVNDLYIDSLTVELKKE